jgi:hypothetical protein
MGRTSYSGSKSFGTYQFSGRGGTKGAQQLFDNLQLTGVKNIQSAGGQGQMGNLNLGGGTTARVIIRPMKGGEGTRVEVQLTSTRYGSRIKTKTNVKIKFESKEATGSQ